MSFLPLFRNDKTIDEEERDPMLYLIIYIAIPCQSGLQCALTKKKLMDISLERQIISLGKQNQEILSVNNQWDQHFKQMKQHYEKQVTEMKAKLDLMQKIVRDLERERYQTQQECKRLAILTRNKLAQEMALWGALKQQNTSLNRSHEEASNGNCNQQEMRIQMAVLQEQAQIYEEDFKRERSDRERLNEEKEVLQRLNEQLQSQLNELNSQIKLYQK